MSSIFFQDEAGKQVRSAIKIKNTSKSHVAFKVKLEFVPFFLFVFCLTF